MTLTVTTVQIDLIWEDKASNFQKINDLLRGCETDLVVLPEMFTTGFSMQPEKLADVFISETLEWMLEKAAAMTAAITGSFICLENGRYYNRLLFVKPDGTFFKYDKRHLFTFGKENEHYTEGSEKLIVEWRGWKICPLVCYDLRFPAWSRNQKANGYYDLLLYIANWPAARSLAWKTLLTARAIENQCYAVGVNRVGEDGNGILHSGESSVIDYEGTLLFHHPNTEGVNTTTLFKDKLENFRTKFGFLEDQDSFLINT